MFDNYIIKNETLYIDLNVNYDFGNFKNTKTNFKKELKKFLNNLKINFNKIVLTCSGVIIGSIILTNNNFNNEEESVFIQIRADKMCPSGYSDNGIKYIEQYEISKHAFKQPKKLVEYLLNNVLRHKTTPEERKIQYIEF